MSKKPAKRPQPDPEGLRCKACGRKLVARAEHQQGICARCAKEKP